MTDWTVLLGMAKPIGDTITLTIDRNNHERTVDVTLEEMPQDKK